MLDRTKIIPVVAVWCLLNKIADLPHYRAEAFAVGLPVSKITNHHNSRLSKAISNTIVYADIQYRNDYADSPVEDGLQNNKFVPPANLMEPFFNNDNDVHVATIMQGEKELETDQLQSSDDETTKARLLLLFCAALFGTNFSFVKILGETGMSIGLSNTLRFGLATLATLPWLLQITQEEIEKQEEEESNSDFALQQQSKSDVDGFMLGLKKLTDPKSTEFKATVAGLEVGMWCSIGYLAQAIGLGTTAASKAAFLCSMTVVIVPLLDFVVGKQILSRQVMGVILAVIGAGFLEFGGIPDGSGHEMMATAFSLSSGDLWSLLQPIGFGIAYCRLERIMATYSNQANRITAAQLLAVFLSSTIFLLFTTTASNTGDTAITTAGVGMDILAQIQQLGSDPMVVFALLWTGVVTTAICLYMEAVALKTLSAAEATLIFSTEPLWGTMWASLLMSEQIGMDFVLGATFILSGCIFSNLGLDGIVNPIKGLLKQRVTGTPTNLEEHGEVVAAHQKMYPSLDYAMTEIPHSADFFTSDINVQKSKK